MNIWFFAFVMFVILFLYAQVGKTIETLDEGNGKYCASCDNLQFAQCIRCINCGYCGDKDSGKCVKGTFMGTDPKDKAKCTRWFSNDPFWRFANSVDKQNSIMTAYDK